MALSCPGEPQTVPNLAALPTAFWSLPETAEFCQGAMTSIIQVMRVSCGAIQSLALSGQHFGE